MRDYYIYKITNKLNGKAYIGQHLIPEKGEQFRWYMGRGIAIQKALKKYGRQNFNKEILEYVKDDPETHLKVSDREIFWIKYYNTLYPNGYNLTPGGEGGCTEESAKKAAKTRQKRGYKHSEETKRKMSLASKGKPKSETHKKHLRDNHKTKSVHTIVFKDGHTEDTTDSITTIAKQFGISEFNVLIRHSAKGEFINGIYLLGIYEGNYACTKSYKSKLLTCKYQDPIKGDTCSYRALYSRIHYGKNKDKYKGIDLYNCIIKEEENEV